MVLGTTGDVAVYVAVLLQPPCHAGGDERLERAEDGRATDARLASTQPIEEILGGDLAAGRGKGVGDQQSLASDAATGVAKAVSGRGSAQCPPTASAKAEKA